MNECGRSKVKQLLRSSMLARLLVPFRAASVRPVWPDEVSSQRSHHTSDHQPGAGRMQQGIYSHLVTQYESFDDCGLQQLPRFDPFPISRDACDGLRSGPWQMRLPQKICSGGIQPHQTTSAVLQFPGLLRCRLPILSTDISVLLLGREMAGHTLFQILFPSCRLSPA